ncbi:class I SAM-dependent methyltransferase [Synechococcus sp. JJ3a-Johnson]|uniref:class I SAM-dependent methyltransferase n=1 Tax=unclassified Synechococcus TaxID=2626047 RepID=UPI0020CBEA27|nr:MULTISPECIES: class I SAM-dependent methyltransferase [unclassified Synechococcus]MCP9830273.1 class I SAM-dependent methyltransferase [Synechococcus sp. JJ3a-Johnson]
MNLPLNRSDVYASPPNHDLINRSKRLSVRRLLDAGAGTGSNLEAIKQLHPDAHTVAITCSSREAKALEHVAAHTITADLNQFRTLYDWQQIGLGEGQFDLILLSHVLEHLQEPDQALASISMLLAPHGLVLIALPNVCHWRTRLQIARGRFRYQDDGVLDRSHLRFFTYWTALELVQGCHGLKLIEYWPVGGGILGPLRSWLPRSVCQWLDHQATQRRPNLFGFETHLLAQRC